MTLSIETQGPPRPVLHHLNADTSWLLQLPNPSSSPGERIFFNILIDPWLKGSQSDVASWFSQQWHSTPSKYQSVEEVSSLAWEAELPESRTRGAYTIDAVSISHEFTDHCHKETLLEIQANVPVFAPKKAAELIRAWKHFEVVIETPVFNDKTRDWKALERGQGSKGAILPDWVRIGRVVEQNNALYYHSAMVILFESTKSGSMSPLQSRNVATTGKSTAQANSQDVDSDTSSSDFGSKVVSECVVYTPHGIAPPALVAPFEAATTKIQTLCLLHGLHDVSLPPVQQLNLGAHNGLQVQRVLKPKYWVGTHDEVKKGGGLVSWFLSRKILNLQNAFDEEKREIDITVGDNVVHFKELANGESILLV
jgi:hypothetical protein